MSKTFIFIRPQPIRDRKAGAILARIEQAGFEILHIKTICNPDKLKDHYKEHKGRAFYPDLLMSNGGLIMPAIVRHVVDPGRSVEIMRAVIGTYDPLVPGTIRGDFGIDFRRNAIHAASTLEDAFRECHIWFE